MGSKTLRIDPSFTSYKPYGFSIDEDPEFMPAPNQGSPSLVNEALERIYKDLRAQP
jgi:hypothetical protein